MLNVVSTRRESRSKSGISRRQLLQVGGLGLAGLTLPDLLRLRAQSRETPRRRPKSVIIIGLSGGPSHIDTYDMKPDAPAEFRGEFGTISSTVPGLRICELLPLQAQIANKFSIVRSLSMGFNDHQNQCELATGFPAQVIGGVPLAPDRPAFGSLVSRLGPATETRLPRYVSLIADDPDHRGLENPRYAGPAHAPFVPSGPGLDNLRLGASMNVDRLSRRTDLLRTFDNLRRDLEVRREITSMDAFTERALDLISSDNVRDAFDITREPAHVVARYTGHPSLARTAGAATGGHPWGATKFIQARRLAEAGVPVVTLFMNGWDHHGKVDGEPLGVFEKLRAMLPAWDRYLSALIEDLHQRGLNEDVAVLAWGEFGRSPRIDQRWVGRDHWPQANFALFAGGGMRMGQTIGRTDARAEAIVERRYTPQSVFATLYQLLGIDSAQTVPNGQGRPMYLLDDREPISELLPT